MAQKIASLYAEIGADTTKLENGLKRTRDGLQGAGAEADKTQSKIGKFASGFGKFALEAGVVALGAAFVEATKSAMELETEFGKIAALTDTPTSAIAGLRKEVTAMSTELPVSAKELSKALYFISSSGFQGAEAMSILNASAMAATAGLGETQTIADAVTSALNAYQLSAKDATRITDLLTFAVKEGKGEPAELAGSLGRVLPVAAAAGVGMEDVSAAMAIMTRTGLSADEAATSLRGTIGALLAPAKQSKDALAEIGLTTDNVAQMLKQPGGLVNVLQLLMERTGGNVEQLDAIIPNIRALTGVLSLAGSQSEAYAAALDEAYRAEGLTADAARIMGDTMDAKLKKAQNAVENLGVAITSKLLPGLGQAADAATTLITWQDKLNEAFEGSSKEIKDNAKSYDEYKDAVLGMAKAAGLITQAELDLITKGHEPLAEKTFDLSTLTQDQAEIYQYEMMQMRTVNGGYAEMATLIDDVSRRTGLLSESDWRLARASEAAVDSARKFISDRDAYFAALNGSAEAAKYDAIATEDDAKAREKLLKASGEATIANQRFIESFANFKQIDLAKQTISDLEEKITANPENRENYAAQIRAISLAAGITTPAMEAAAASFRTLEEAWTAGNIATPSYLEALGKLKTAAADGVVSVDELGLKTGEAAAYMTTAAGSAKSAQDTIVNDSRSAKEKMLDEFEGALKRQQGTLTEKISTSMIAVSNSLTVASSLSTEKVDQIIADWERIPTDVTTTYHIVKIGDTTPPAPGFAGGADFVVPPGYPNDSYNMRVQSGERVQVTPANERSNGDNSLTFNIYGAPGMNEEVLAAKVSQRVARQLRSARAV